MQIPYEAPRAPELTLRGDLGSPAQSAAALMAFLEGRGWISAAR
jgi:adenylylsulfate kinase-like enzyme